MRQTNQAIKISQWKLNQMMMIPQQGDMRKEYKDVKNL